MRTLPLASLLVLVSLAASARDLERSPDLKQLIDQTRARAGAFGLRPELVKDAQALQLAGQELDEIGAAAKNTAVKTDVQRMTRARLDEALARATSLLKASPSGAEVQRSLNAVAEAGRRVLDAADHVDGQAQVELVSTRGGEMASAFNSRATSSLNSIGAGIAGRSAGPEPAPAPTPAAAPPQRGFVTYAVPAVPHVSAPPASRETLAGLTAPVTGATRAAFKGLLPTSTFDWTRAVVTKTLTGSSALMGAATVKPVMAVENIEAPKQNAVLISPLGDLKGKTTPVYGARLDWWSAGDFGVMLRARADAGTGPHAHDISGALTLDKVSATASYAQTARRRQLASGLTFNPAKDVSLDFGLKTTQSVATGARGYGAYFNPAIEVNKVYYGVEASAGTNPDSKKIDASLMGRIATTQPVLDAVVGALFASN